MLRATPVVGKMATTRGGMRRILKTRLPVQKYIELAVKAGSYKTPSTRPHYLGLHDVPPPNKVLTPREREERVKLERGIIDYPTQYEILSLNPPLPRPPRTPVRDRKRLLADKKRLLAKQRKERRRRGLPEDDDLPRQLPSMDRLVRSYLRRYEDRVRAGVSLNQSKREEEYYSRLLLGKESVEEAKEEATNEKFMKFQNPSSLRTAMGRKSALVENAYAFALKQQKVLMEDASAGEGDGITEEESVERVEQLLREEARASRQMGRRTAEDVAEWRAREKAASEEDKKDDVDDYDDDKSTIPSILHDRPRAIRALNIWSARLRSIPYARWTVGASTALDHWIAREVLRMDEQTWEKVLEGGGTDAYTEGFGRDDVLPGGEDRAGLMDRTRDIVLVRGALFPETLWREGTDAGDGESGITGELDDALLPDDDVNATEKSIDELLASLGELDDDDEEGNPWKFDEEEEEEEVKEEEEKEEEMKDEEERMASILDELQVWRERNASSPYEAWDVDRKNEFDEWIEKYVATLYPEADASTVDKEATRNSLLSERPIDAEKTKEFWAKVRTETEAEIFLRDYRTGAKKKLQSLTETETLTEEERRTKSELEVILSVPFDKQLDKIVKMGALRPILDEYAPLSEREDFFARYASLFLEGLEMEHLVPDPDGPIGLADIGADLREEFARDWAPGSDMGIEPRFAVRMVPYGTDEFGATRAQRARELYRLWNEHKANRARFEEALFKRGHLGVEEDGVRGRKKGTKGKKQR